MLQPGSGSLSVTDKNREGTTHPDIPALKVQGKSKWKAREKAELWTGLGGELGRLQSLLLKAAGCQCAGHRGVGSPEILRSQFWGVSLQLAESTPRVCPFCPNISACVPSCQVSQLQAGQSLGCWGRNPLVSAPAEWKERTKSRERGPQPLRACRSPLPCAQPRSRSVQRLTRRANMESPRAVACSWMTERQSSERHSAGQRESSDTTSSLHLGSRVVRDEQTLGSHLPWSPLLRRQGKFYFIWLSGQLWPRGRGRAAHGVPRGATSTEAAAWSPGLPLEEGVWVSVKRVISCLFDLPPCWSCNLSS